MTNQTRKKISDSYAFNTLKTLGATKARHMASCSACKYGMHCDKVEMLDLRRKLTLGRVKNGS